IDEESINNPAYVSMTNWTGKNFRGEIIFEVPKDETSPLLSDVAEIIVTFDEEIYKTIVDNWNLTYGLEISKDRDNSFIIAKDSASISGLLFEQEELNLLGLSVEFFIDKETDKNDYKYNITLRNLENNTVVGGEQYVIHKPELRQEIVANAGEDQIVTLGEIATLSAQTTGTDVSYKWIDSHNDTTINSQIAEVSPAITQQYKLKVKTDNGYIGYDSLNVVVKKNIINNITPQPATDFAVINYQIMQANNAYIEITNGFGTVLENFQINTELNQYSFDCSSLPSGIYTVILYCDGYRQDAKNLIIE
ncbi:MAG: T9SS type A sorting domain-containing protein, partial [Bacteroidales bacterium]|nr:T9SS type A sorting domain-containing protein [Bacteroidales bacterium]